MSGANVSPCTTSVTRMTQKVRKTMTFLWAMTAGSERAAASAITPRIPVHPTMKIARGDGSGSSCLRNRTRIN